VSIQQHLTHHPNPRGVLLTHTHHNPRLLYLQRGGALFPHFIYILLLNPLTRCPSPHPTCTKIPKISMMIFIPTSIWLRSPLAQRLSITIPICLAPFLSRPPARAGTLTLQVAPIAPPAPLSLTRVIRAIRAARMRPAVFALKCGRSTTVGADLRSPPTGSPPTLLTLMTCLDPLLAPTQRRLAATLSP
jgi:hypothetical protein